MALIWVDELFDLFALGLVGGDVGPARHGNLDERALLGVEESGVEQFTEGPEALRDPLGVVEAIDAEEDGLDIQVPCDAAAACRAALLPSESQWAKSIEIGKASTSTA